MYGQHFAFAHILVCVFFQVDADLYIYTHNGYIRDICDMCYTVVYVFVLFTYSVVLCSSALLSVFYPPNPVPPCGHMTRPQIPSNSYQSTSSANAADTQCCQLIRTVSANAHLLGPESLIMETLTGGRRKPGFQIVWLFINQRKTKFLSKFLKLGA